MLLSTFLPDVDLPTPDPGATAHPNARGFALANNLLFVASDAGGLRVVAVSDLRAPREIAKYINAGVGNKPQACSNVVVDVADPARPVLAGGYGEPDDDQAVWGLDVDGNSVYLACIQALIPCRGTWSGVRAVSIR